VVAFAELVVVHIVGPGLAVVGIEVEPVGIVAMVGPRIVVQRKRELGLLVVVAIAVVGNRLEQLEVAVGKLERLAVVCIAGLAIERLSELVVAVVRHFGCISFGKQFFCLEWWPFGCFWV